jgi:plastocyanin
MDEAAAPERPGAAIIALPWLSAIAIAAVRVLWSVGYNDLGSTKKMRLSSALLVLSLAVVASAGQAADVVLNVEDGGFVPDTVKMRVGDRLVVINKSGKKQWVWGQGGDYAFDFRSTAENNWTHDSGQSLGIVLRFPGKYRIGNAADGTMHATALVEQ